MSTLVARRILDCMDTEITLVTRKEAALLAGVTERTINRWSQRGLVTVYRPDGPWGLSWYVRDEVVRQALRKAADLPLPTLPSETDIST